MLLIDIRSTNASAAEFILYRLKLYLAGRHHHHFERVKKGAKSGSKNFYEYEYLAATAPYQDGTTQRHNRTGQPVGQRRAVRDEAEAGMLGLLRLAFNTRKRWRRQA